VEAGRAPISEDAAEEVQVASGWQRLPEKTPRVEEVIRRGEQSCQQCGAKTIVIGSDESEQLDAEPARYFVEPGIHTGLQTRMGQDRHRSRLRGK
jgi:transposase